MSQHKVTRTCDTQTCTWMTLVSVVFMRVYYVAPVVDGVVNDDEVVDDVTAAGCSVRPLLRSRVGISGCDDLVDRRRLGT